MVDAIDRYLARAGARCVLEVGVGSGRLLEALRDRGYRVLGVDHSAVAARLSGAVVASATELPFATGTLDALVSVSVIEHLHQDQGQHFLSEARRVVRSGGVLFLATPNLRSPMRALLRDRWFGYSDPTHVFFYSPLSLRRAMRAAGFDDIRLTFQSSCADLDWPLPRTVLRLPPPARVLVNKLLVSTPVALVRDSFWIGGHRP